MGLFGIGKKASRQDTPQPADSMPRVPPPPSMQQGSHPEDIASSIDAQLAELQNLSQPKLQPAPAQPAADDHTDWTSPIDHPDRLPDHATADAPGQDQQTQPQPMQPIPIEQAEKEVPAVQQQSAPPAASTAPPSQLDGMQPAEAQPDSHEESESQPSDDMNISLPDFEDNGQAAEDSGESESEPGGEGMSGFAFDSGDADEVPAIDATLTKQEKQVGKIFSQKKPAKYDPSHPELYSDLDTPPMPMTKSPTDVDVFVNLKQYASISDYLSQIKKVMNSRSASVMKAGDKQETNEILGQFHNTVENAHKTIMKIDAIIFEGNS